MTENTGLTHLSICKLRSLLDRHLLSGTELTTSCLVALNTYNAQLGAVITETRELALEAARRYDLEQPSGLLAGIPFLVKDNLCTRGIRTTCASRMLEGFVPCYNATVVERCLSRSGILLGKTNMDEFGMGSTGEHSYFGATKNPHNTRYTAGGSSSGSAAAVAAGFAPYALGSDTGGSVRQPAAFCGVVGMKPTYGAVSRFGLIAFASSLDQVGFFTRTVEDNALVFSELAAKDERDATSQLSVTDTLTNLKKGVRGMKIALLTELPGVPIDPQVTSCVTRAAKLLEQLGACVCEVRMPTFSPALEAYYILSSAEASSNLARFDGVRYGYRADGYTSIEELYTASRSFGFGKEVKRRITLGTFVLSSGSYEAYYARAQSVRHSVRAEFEGLFDEYALLLSPVTTRPAYALGEMKDNVLDVYKDDSFTVPASLAGLPALSLPCGESDKGLPIGVQLTGKAFSEPLIYRAAFSLEKALSGEEHDDV